MEKYENILKLINDAIARYESDVNWYREQYHQATEKVADLTAENKLLKEKIENLTF